MSFIKKGRNVDADVKITYKTYLKPFLYLLPFIISISIFTIYPFFNAFVISLKENYKALSGSFTGFGFGNYDYVLTNETFILALKNTITYVLWVVPISTALSLLVAVMLNRKTKLQAFFQTAYFLPLVTSAIAIGLVWRWLFNFDYGLINFVLSRLGAEAINWLNNPGYAKVALIVYGIWSMMPFTIILLLAGLQNINKQYLIAAQVDGSKPIQTFTYITVPLLAPTIGLTMIVNMITGFKVFNELFALFNGKPGPAYSLYTVIYFMYEQFYVKYRLGTAAASAIALFFIVMILTLIQLYMQRKWKNY